MNPALPSPARGLTASELSLVVAELRLRLPGSEVIDVVLLRSGDDLLLVLQSEDGKEFVHVAPGSKRARVTTTERRFGRDERLSGPKADAMRTQLAGRALLRIDQPRGERRLRLQFAGGLQLEVELFSTRGLWALLDGSDAILEMSRPVATAVRTLAVGGRYVPPPAAAVTTPEPPPRFAAPVLAGIDRHFTEQDLVEEANAAREQLRLCADRALARTQKKILGLRTQIDESGRIDAIRAEADLMLAYAHAVVRGAASMTVPDPCSGEQRTIELDPSKPVIVQAQARYERARRLQDGLAISEQRLAAATHEVAALAPLQQRLLATTGLSPDEVLHLRAALQRLGALPRPKPATTAAPAAKDRRIQGENVRRFVSAEGYEILVGRDNEQNDRLSLRIANGNDIWLHIGGGRPGSHVVVRLPKGKTASLETMLDAGTLAVHFSKARDERTIDVVYTLAKHVRKPKGLPAGTVVPSQTKTITIRLDELRRRRLLDSAADSE